MKNKMIKAILFDLNKVLVNHKTMDDEYMNEFGMNQYDFWKPRGEFLKDHITGKISLDRFILNIMDRNNLDKNKLPEAKKLHEEIFSPVYGMREILQSLKNNYSLILVAGDGEESMEMKLKKGKFTHYFDKIYATYYFKLDKDEPNFYKKVLEEINLNATEIIFIDDQERYIVAAKKLGIQTILFENSLKLKKDLETKFNITV